VRFTAIAVNRTLIAILIVQLLLATVFVVLAAGGVLRP